MYIVSYCLHITEKLADDNIYKDPAREFSIRLILFSEIKANQNWIKLTNILFEDIIDFLIERGECWVNENIGNASIHYQWDSLINDIFNISNNMSKSKEQRKMEIKMLLSENEDSTT